MKLGTRGSKLAMAQANKVRRLLAERRASVDIVAIRTSGDVHTSEPLHAMKGGVGAFVREIDDRLLAGEVDAAVHSLKDVPTKRPPEIPVYDHDDLARILREYGEEPRARRIAAAIDRELGFAERLGLGMSDERAKSPPHATHYIRGKAGRNG